jgi:phosphatidate cytidylyltransferase
VSARALVLAWVAGLFSFGAAAIAVYAAGKPDEGRELWRVFASTVVIAAAFLVPAAIHPWLFSAVVAAAAWRCAFELAATYGIRVGAAGHAALAAAAAGAVWWGAPGDAPSSTALLVATAALLALTAPLYIAAFARPPTNFRARIVAAAFPLLAAAHLSHLAHAGDGFVWLCVLYATVETQDSMAFLCGRVFGRRRVLPRLSPNKTLEGAIAGACCGVSVGGAMAWGLLHLAPAAAVGVAALVMTAGFCGDLFTSALKRAAQVKDFPRLHRLHGGVLDIYDSTLFAAVPLSIITAFAVPPI